MGWVFYHDIHSLRELFYHIAYVGGYVSIIVDLRDYCCCNAHVGTYTTTIMTYPVYSHKGGSREGKVYTVQTTTSDKVEVVSNRPPTLDLYNKQKT